MAVTITSFEKYTEIVKFKHDWISDDYSSNREITFEPRQFINASKNIWKIHRSLLKLKNLFILFDENNTQSYVLSSSNGKVIRGRPWSTYAKK